MDHRRPPSPSPLSSPTAAPPGRRWLAVLMILLLVGSAVAVFLYRLPGQTDPIEVPSIATDGMEEPVAAAVRSAREHVVADPQSADAWGHVGLVLLANNLNQESLAWLERAEALAPSDGRWPYHLGCALADSDPEASIAALRRSVEVVPSDAARRLRLAEALAGADRPEEAERVFDDLLRLQPEHPRGLLGRARGLLRRGQTAAAIPLLEKAAASPTARKAALSTLAEAHLRGGDASAAADAQRRAEAAPRDMPTPDVNLIVHAELAVNLHARLLRAETFAAFGKLDLALATLEEARRDRPDAAEIPLTRGQMLSQAERYEEAEAAARQAIALDAKSADAHALLGSLLLRRGDAPGAEQALRAALAVRPADAQLHFDLGTCLLKTNDPAGAKTAFEAAVRYRPAFAAAHRALGELHLNAGNPAAARASLETADKLEPDNARTRELLQKARR